MQGVSCSVLYDPTCVGDTPSRRTVFTCRPAAAADEEPCARSIVSRLATRAFRLPDAEGAGVDALMKFYRDGYAKGGFEAGIQHALARILVDPRFILRFEGPATGTAGLLRARVALARVSRS